MPYSWPQAAHPALTDDTCTLTSKAVNRYNCIAWAAGENHRWWWPIRGAYWPVGVPVSESIPAFVAAFQTLGYEICADATLEEGYQKVAIYAKVLLGFVIPTHASRQLASGTWTSKMGSLEDIIHLDPTDVDGPDYGQAMLYLKRARASPDPTPSEPY
jgi:hypothetical protein